MRLALLLVEYLGFHSGTFIHALLVLRFDTVTARRVWQRGPRVRSISTFDAARASHG
jgi:hypothetical protein